ncbi:rhamnulokinase [Pseudactinotalea sp. HY160]|uniref:rhamnulokinase n=1 Tax=Pseudactinotalea sp. HY160 TaxID=2654490 RepID=UPI00128E06AC|nr:rhamnulokinase family protein [Pseudactinotalea sp. HY160]MPV50899.1 rhamnulokinase [Pseudactinotalea sp. HY160]
MASTTRTVAAVDLGATSGRVMAGRLTGAAGRAEVHLEEVARFRNGPAPLASGLHWDFTGLLGALARGVAACVREHGAASIAVDSWAVDYGLLRGDRLLGDPFHYRDPRTARGVAYVHERLDFAALYARTGLQFLPFNTLYQLAAERGGGVLEAADSLLLMPDLVNFQLAGVRATERTNASTTGMLDVHTGDWDPAILRAAGVDRALLAPLVDPGELIGPTHARASEYWHIPAGVPVLSVGSHDTASAVAAVPMDPGTSAYVSCGTWGLVGVETAAPVTTEAARAANFTNEGGVDGRIRLLRNVMGLWLLSESVRTWQRSGLDVSVPALLREAARVEEAPLFDVDDEAFLAPGDMPARITAWFTGRGLRAPAGPAAVTRSIVESLAEAFARTAHDAARLGGITPLRTIHVVGGGSLNELLCQRTADRAGLPVVAGPVEGTALGNVLVQARHHGWVTGGLEELRAVVARSVELRRFEPAA